MLIIEVKSKNELLERLKTKELYEAVFVHFVLLLETGKRLSISNCCKHIVFKLQNKNIFIITNDKNLKCKVVLFIEHAYTQSVNYNYFKEIMNKSKIYNINKINKVNNCKSFEESITVQNLLNILPAQDTCNLYDIRKNRLTRTTFIINDLINHQLYDVIKNCIVHKCQALSCNYYKIIVK